jgi:hypothetical protein
MYNPLDKRQVLRTQKDRSRIMVPYPLTVAEFNKNMGGVDHFDQHRSVHSISWKSRRWWLKFLLLLFRCSDSKQCNLYQNCWKNSNQTFKHLSHIRFRSVLEDEPIGNIAQEQRGKR